MIGTGLTDVPGVRVGHYTDRDAATGCTVVLCESGAVGGVDVRGSAPGTRETDLLRASNLVSEAHAVLLTGGSAFGLDAASGVVRYLEDKGVGYPVGDVRVPIVPAAVLNDLRLGVADVRPGADEGYAAAQAATAGPIAEGSVGAGTGATVGKLLGIQGAVKGGIGTYATDLGSGLTVAAIVAVNALGGVYDPETGEVVAGPRHENGTGMHDSLKLATSPNGTIDDRASSNTAIGVVATNATLSKEQANKVASVSQDGIAMAIRPAHTMGDGDTMFALATGDLEQPADMLRICAAAALSVSKAIVRAVRLAESLGGVPSVTELGR